MTLLAPTLQAFFTERLMTQQNASPHTVASYRDCLRLLVCFARTSTGAQPSHLTIEQVDAALVGAFLDHLEHDRGVSIATRNARLPAATGRQTPCSPSSSSCDYANAPSPGTTAGQAAPQRRRITTRSR